MSARIVPLPADEVVPRSLAGVFFYVPHGERIRCAICGQSGFPLYGTDYPRWWGWKHREHVPCPTCGKPCTPRSGLAAHRRRLHGERGIGLGRAS